VPLIGTPKSLAGDHVRAGTVVPPTVLPREVSSPSPALRNSVAHDVPYDPVALHEDFRASDDGDAARPLKEMMLRAA